MVHVCPLILVVQHRMEQPSTTRDAWLGNARKSMAVARKYPTTWPSMPASFAVLEWFAERDLFNAEMRILGDSNLVIQQMFGSWRIKKGLYAPLVEQI